MIQSAVALSCLAVAAVTADSFSEQAFFPQFDDIRSRTNTSLCLETKVPILAGLAKCTGMTNQRYVMDNLDRIVHVASGQCMADMSGDGAENAAITFTTCADVPSQKWSGDDKGHLKVASSTSKCLTIVDTTQTAIRECSDDDEQRWFLGTVEAIISHEPAPSATPIALIITMCVCTLAIAGAVVYFARRRYRMKRTAADFAHAVLDGDNTPTTVKNIHASTSRSAYHLVK